MTSTRISEPQRQRSVLIADDHPLMRRVLRELIEDEPDLRVIGEARDGAEAVGVLRDALNGHAGVAVIEAAQVDVHVDPCELTQREFSVLREIANGKSNHAIGKALHVSEETVKTRIKKILQKLGAEDRAHAVALAVRRGYLDCLGP